MPGNVVYGLKQDTEPTIVPFTANPNNQSPLNTSITRTTQTSSAITFTTVSPKLVDFTFNLTLLNVDYNIQFEDQSSDLYRVMSAILISLVNPIFQNSSIGDAFSGCEGMTFRQGKVPNSFRINSVCSYKNNSVGQTFDRQTVYKNFSALTNGITNLDKYALDSSSLYIDGYNEKILSTPAPITSPSTNVPSVSTFSLNLTMSNLQYTPDLGTRYSSKFNNTEAILTNLMASILKQTSVGPSYAGCQINTFSAVDSGAATKVDAVCTYDNKTLPVLDRVRIYNEIRNLTNDVTILGIYSLNSNSLYVNGYNENTQTTPPPTTTQILNLSSTSIFTLNFTLTNLQYTSDLGIPYSSKWNNTEAIFLRLLETELKKTSLASSYSGCQIRSFSAVDSGAATKVDAVCTYDNKTLPVLDRVRIYNEIRNLTNDVTKLGIYSLNSNSLYVNEYNEKTQPTLPPLVNSFTLNLTLTNLMHTSDLGMPSSLKFNNTKAIISNMLDTVIKNTSLAPSYTGCEIKEFRSAAGGSSTKVNSVCTFISTSSAPSFDRVSFYKEISKQTNNITKLGIYSVNPSSLYVNEYNEPITSVETPIIAVTVPSVEASNSEKITLNFTILNMPYTSDLGTISSGKFNSTAAVVVYLLDNVFKNSSVKSTYTKCIIDSFVSDLSGTKVNSICTIRRDATDTPFDKVAFYKEMETLTKGVTTLGTYKLDKNTLYVNGYNESPKATTIKPLTNVTTASVFGPRQFFINFTITNLNHTSKLENKTSEQYMKIENLLNQLLSKVFKNTPFKDKFVNCSVTGFRSTPPFPYTTAESVCVFNVDLLAKAPIEEDILNAFINGTEDGSSLGNFTLQKLSIHIDPYISDVSTQPPSTNVGAAAVTTTATTAIPMLSSADLGFNINYTIINQYVPSDPEAKMKMQLEIEQAMNKLYQNSSLARKFKFCKLAEMRNGSIIASCNCYFEDDPIINKQSVEKEFYNGTITGKLLGSNFLLKDISVAEIPKDNDLPFWAIILICLAVLFGLVLLFLAIFALAFCLKKKKGFYDFQHSIYGTYFPHLDMRKLY